MEMMAPGQVVGGRYRLVRPLARGGMATVWVADDPVLSRQVAVKILRDDLAADPATRARFRQEALAAARLSHPNIVTTYDTGDDQGVAYIVMELVHGPTLRRLIDETHGLAVRDVVRIGMEVAEALEAAHRAGIVHRDVKPANVLVPPDGRVKVTDFGIAKAGAGGDLTRTGTVMGTARYLAPEQVNGRATDARTDVYALGLLLYEALTGHPPFGGDTDIATAMARLTTSAPAIRTERPTVSQALDDIVHRCLARRPEARYGSAAQVRDALLHAGDQPSTVLPTMATRDPTGSRVPPTRAEARGPDTAVHSAPFVAVRRRRTGWWWIAALTALVVAGAAVAVYLVARDDGSSPRQAGSPPASAATATLTAHDWDPFGDHQEDPTHVADVVTGQGQPWSTEHYVDFSRDKPGVGLVLDLGDELAVRHVTVTTVESGWSGEIHLSSQPSTALLSATTLEPWGKAAVARSGNGTSTTFDLGSTRARSILLWITALPGPSGQQLLEVIHVTVG